MTGKSVSMSWLKHKRCMLIDEHSSLRLWSLSGDTLMELHGHTSYVYSVSVLSTGELVSSGEDGCVRVWKGKATVLLLQGTDCYPALTQ